LNSRTPTLVCSHEGLHYPLLTPSVEPLRTRLCGPLFALPLLRRRTLATATLTITATRTLTIVHAAPPRRRILSASTVCAAAHPAPAPHPSLGPRRSSPQHPNSTPSSTPSPHTAGCSLGVRGRSIASRSQHSVARYLRVFLTDSGFCLLSTSRPFSRKMYLKFACDLYCSTHLSTWFAW
jgi:hypothetical protein